jgi:PrtD family type I secretion system ABC transporter
MQEFLLRCRAHIVHAALFSLVINILSLAVPLYTLQVFDRVFSSRSQETLLVLTLAAAIALSTMMLLEIVRSRLLLMAGSMLDRQMSPKVLSILLNEAATSGGSKYPNCMRDAGILRNYLGGNGVVTLFDVPWMPGFMLVIYLFHPLLGALALLGAAALFTLAWVNERITRAPQEQVMSRSRQAGRFIDAALRNAEIVQAQGMGNNVIRLWEGLNAQSIESQIKGSVRSSNMAAFARFARMILQVLMLATGAYLVIRQQMTPGGMMAGTLILSKALGPVESAISNWKGFIDARGAYERLSCLMDEAAPNTTRTMLPPPTGQLSVDKLIFGFRKTDRPFLKSISFELAAGESLGIIGPSGAGKSTLARMLTGVWQPVAGTVRLDGANIVDWDRSHLAKFFGYLPQDVELFPGTVRENIARLGEVSDEEVVGAAQRALAHDMILRLPKGYDTEVGEGGMFLAGGQRQRVGYVRALLGEPKLVVLDEPNANLDGAGEDALLRSIETLRRDGVTVVIVSHKPSVLANVDKLLVLRDGAMELFGPRAEVMARLTRPLPTGNTKPMDDGNAAPLA